MGGWSGYNARLNGKYEPVYAQVVGGRPVYSHLHRDGEGGGINWCRMWWARGAWRIGHVQWLSECPEVAVAYCVSDARVPFEIDPSAPWVQHIGERAGKDHGKEPYEFKAAQGVYVTSSSAHGASIVGGPSGVGSGGGGSSEEVRHVRQETRLTWLASQQLAASYGGRLLTLDEARKYLHGKPLYAGENQWCAVTDERGERDWVQVGSSLHDAGKSHVHDCFSYPEWGDDVDDRTYGETTWNRILLYRSLPHGAIAPDDTKASDGGKATAGGRVVLGTPVLTATPSAVTGKVVSA